MSSSSRPAATTRIRVVAGAIIRHQTVLIAQRARSADQAGLWELPGGKVQTNESDGDALVRELEEELGIQVSVTGELGISDYDYPHICIRLVGLTATLISGHPEAREHHAIRWVGPDELQHLQWSPADIPLLGVLESHLRSLPSEPT